MSSFRWILVSVFLFLPPAGPGLLSQPALGSLVELQPPAGRGSAQPFLAVSKTGVLYMSWMEPGLKGKHSFRFASYDGTAWSAPGIIAEGNDFFVNWADVPSFVTHSDGTVLAHWLKKSGPSTYAYDVQLSLSKDGGAAWSVPITPHRDGTQTEHGFVSLFELTEKTFGLVWLDGREMIMAESSNHSAHGEGGMTLRSAVYSTDGRLLEEHLLDSLVCECCPTAATATHNGILVAYRDRSMREIRNIYAALYDRGTWSRPQLVFDDGWKIPGCPVNGPALATEGHTSAIAWFTAPEGNARVNLAFTNDDAVSFGKPIRVDDGKPLGRVGLILLPDGSALVVWLEYIEEGAELRGRIVSSSGAKGKSLLIAKMSADRASGYPRVARSGNRIFFAWTETGDVKNVKVAETLLQIR